MQCQREGYSSTKEPVPGMTQTLWEDVETYRKEYWDTRPLQKVDTSRETVLIWMRMAISGSAEGLTRL